MQREFHVSSVRLAAAADRGRHWRNRLLHIFGIRYHRGHVWEVLDDLGWSCQRPVGRARERNEEEIRTWKWKRVHWPAIKKARNEGRTIIFLDESGISQRPHRVRTWSRRGRTPVLQYNFNWDTISAVVGITYNFYFRLYKGSVKSAERSWTSSQLFSGMCPARC